MTERMCRLCHRHQKRGTGMMLFLIGKHYFCGDCIDALNLIFKRFYVLQVQIPNKKKQEKQNEKIKKR